MSYFADLTPYDYIPRRYPVSKNKISYQVVNIGWLDKQHPFLQIPTERAFHRRLFDFSQYRINQTRGFFDCEFCGKLDESDITQISSCETRVFGSDGVVYASPELICHYVVAHHYRPPNVFIEAVMNGPQPFTETYEKLLFEYGYHYDQHFNLKRRPYPASLLD
jgi:hypothetical protein